jgi:hypothetical protein
MKHKILSPGFFHKNSIWLFFWYRFLYYLIKTVIFVLSCNLWIICPLLINVQLEDSSPLEFYDLLPVNK